MQINWHEFLHSLDHFGPGLYNKNGIMRTNDSKWWVFDKKDRPCGPFRGLKECELFKDQLLYASDIK